MTHTAAVASLLVRRRSTAQQRTFGLSTISTRRWSSIFVPLANRLGRRRTND